MAEKKKSKQKKNDQVAEEELPQLGNLSLGPRTLVSRKSKLPTTTAVETRRTKLKEQLQSLAANLEQECYKIVFEIFPEKIQQLDKMYKEDPIFNLSPGEIYEEIPIPKIEPGLSKVDYERALFATPIPANSKIIKLIELMEREVVQLSDMMSTLSIWVKLNVPRISDGNNFGVEVQEQIMDLLDSTENSGYAVLDGFNVYHLSRAQLVVEVLKHPGIEDYRRSLKELDEKTFMKTALIASELRNDYITLYDIITKNIETLKTPRHDEEEVYKRMY